MFHFDRSHRLVHDGGIVCFIQQWYSLWNDLARTFHWRRKIITEIRWSNTVPRRGPQRQQQLFKVRKKMENVPPHYSRRNSVFKLSGQESKSSSGSQIKILCSYSQESSKSVVKPFENIRQDQAGPGHQVTGPAISDYVIYRKPFTFDEFRSTILIHSPGSSESDWTATLGLEAP